MIGQLKLQLGVYVMSKNEDFKTTITKMVKITAATEKGKKSSGTKIGTIARDISLTVISPFTS